MGVNRDGLFNTRPNMVVYPDDIRTQIRQGAVEFHCSLERWANPMLLHAEQRQGFDLILDLDCKRVEHGKAAALVLIAALERHGIQGYSLKFSGNRGFHLGIPWESLPQEIGGQPTASLFPEVARTVGLYLREVVRLPLAQALLLLGSAEQLAEQAEKPLDIVLAGEGIDPFQVADIDPVLISPRHLFRMAYSLNRKAYLVSLPLTKEQLTGFAPEQALPERVRPRLGYLDQGRPGEANLLFMEALDWAARQRKQERRPGRKVDYTRKIPEQQFPPCIKLIQQGLQDGRKRALFILQNFLQTMKWPAQDQEDFLRAWNQKNRPPLPEQQLLQSLRYSQNRKPYPPPNCTAAWYVDLRVCQPDQICISRESLKNPVNYPFRLMKRQERQKPRRQARPKGSSPPAQQSPKA
ncbi:MAG: hypothetical protein HY520_03815 [Candidatus Aenigmarchaeota archaeon]|nr:hypothetical protein [Candidatus Aenigmarchaeota archaeon]